MNLKHLLTKLNPFSKKIPKIHESEEPAPTQPEVSDPVVEDVIETPIVHEETKGKIVSNDRWKFSEDEKQMIVALIGQGHTPSEIIETMKENYGIKVSDTQIYKYKNSEKWKPLIKKISDAHMADLASVPGFNKKVRLSRHEKIYDKAMKNGKLKDAISATVEQRKEVEGDINNSVVNNTLNIYSDEELDFKKKQVMERIRLMTEHKGETK